MSVWWYFDTNLAHCKSKQGSPATVLLGTSQWSHHDRETWHWGVYSTAGELREGNKAAQTLSSCHSSNRVWWGYVCTNLKAFSHSCARTLQHRTSWTVSHCSFLLKYAKLHIYILTHTHIHAVHIQSCTHRHSRTALMKTPIADRTARWLAQRKHYTSTFRHMACGPTDGHTHMVLVASAASHGRKAQCLPLIRLQITVHSTQSTVWKSLTVRDTSFCLII